MATIKSVALKLGLPLMILILAIGGFLALRATRSPALPVQAQEKVWQVSVVEVQPTQHTPEVLLYGVVEAPRQADLSAAVAAEVAQVPIAEGQSVEMDQVLVVLDERDIGLALRQREADAEEIRAMIESERKRHRSDLDVLEHEKTLLDLNRRAVERAEDLRRRKVGSESLLDEARMALERQALAVNTRQLSVDDHAARLAQLQARLARAEALRDQAHLDLQRTRIVAPFAGRIATLTAAPGDRVRVGDPLLSMYATNELEIRAQIPFRYLPIVRASLAAGRPLVAEAIVDGQSIPLRLDRLSARAADSAGGVDGLLRPVDATPTWVPGRLLSLALRLPPESETVALPPAALYGLDRIYRLEDGRMAALTVERIGERFDATGGSQVLVRSPDLREGDKIITTQLPNAVSGLKVAVPTS
ncbi:MAG: biotin/lipoyl-binding protein [Gammaproteobacteria bacterium]|nr:biotin/lipoyl-binding protein [Gammaproteobacteria bacterium]